MSNNNNNSNNQTGDWIVHDRARLNARPWGEIRWAIAEGSTLSVMFVYITLTTCTDFKPNKLVLSTTAIAGSLVSLYMNRKKFTHIARTEKFIPDQK
jgi:hypothetical protein